MIETREVVVEGRTYQVTQFSASKGIKMFTRLTKLVGEPLGLFMSDGESEAHKVIPLAIRALSDRLDEDYVLDTIKELLKGVRGSDGELDFDSYFAGKLGMLSKLLFKVLEVQYGDFLGDLVAKGKDPMEKKTRMMKV